MGAWAIIYIAIREKENRKKNEKTLPPKEGKKTEC
jgi:hypothetical protein